MYIGYGTDALLSRFCWPNINKLPEGFTKEYENIIGDFGIDDIQTYFEDITISIPVYYYCIGTCLVVAVVYNILLRFFSKIIIWLSIVGTGGGLLGLSLFLRKYHEDHYMMDPPMYSEDMGKVLQGVIYILYAATGLYFCCILCMFKNIAISVSVLQTASIIIIRNIRTLLIPFISFFVVAAFIFGWLVGFGYLLSCANIV